MGTSTYQDTVAKGDVVERPNGHLAIVTDVDIIVAGHVQEVTLFDFNSLVLSLLGKLWVGNLVYDAAINDLRKIDPTVNS